MGLDPDVNHGAWTDAESEILLARREQIGAKWAEVASGLPGRTNNSCKNQWRSLERQVVRSSPDGVRPWR